MWRHIAEVYTNELYGDLFIKGNSTMIVLKDIESGMPYVDFYSMKEFIELTHMECSLGNAPLIKPIEANMNYFPENDLEKLSDFL